MPLEDVKLGWWIKLRMGWAKLVPPDTVLIENDQGKLMVSRLPDDLPGGTLVVVAERRPDGASRMLGVTYQRQQLERGYGCTVASSPLLCWPER